MRRYLPLLFVGSATFASGCLTGLFDLPDCIADEPSVSGTLSTAQGELDFDAAFVNLDVSDLEGSDSCVTSVRVEASKGGEYGGCRITADTTPLIDAEGRLVVHSLSFRVTKSECPTWNLEDGSYSTTRDEGELGGFVIDGAAAAPGTLGYSCFEGTLGLELNAMTLSDGASSVSFDATRLDFSVDTSAYAESASCPTPL